MKLDYNSAFASHNLVRIYLGRGLLDNEVDGDPISDRKAADVSSTGHDAKISPYCTTLTVSFLRDIIILYYFLTCCMQSWKQKRFCQV